MKKRHATILALIIIVAMYFTTLFIAPDVLKTIGGAMVMAVALSGGFHIAGECGSNYTQSRYYRPELDDRNLEGGKYDNRSDYPPRPPCI